MILPNLIAIVTTSSVLLVANSQALPPLPNPPRIPASYPSIDQALMISADRLLDPVIVEAVAYVRSVVPASVLSLPVSTYRPATPTTPLYNGNATANCYWPVGDCLRSADTSNFKADISSCPNANDWGLTYDDGPSVDPLFGTSQLLSALQSTNAIKSTFFIVGSNAFQYPTVVKDIDTAGHELALHSWSHHPMTSLTTEQVVAELKYNEAIIYQSTGKVPTIFRPPYGDIDDRVRAIVAALGYRVIMWGFDSGDTGSNPATAAPAQMLTWLTAKPGFITLQHDITPITTKIAIDALTVIRGIRSLGTRPQPVSLCLGIPKDKWYKSGAVNSTTAVVTPTPGKDGSSAGGRAGADSGASDVVGLLSGFGLLFGMALLV